MKGDGVADVLMRITARRRERLGTAGAEPRTAAGPRRGEPFERGENPFLAALAARSAAAPWQPAIIAEVKLGSPRLGSLNGRIDPEAQARSYAEGGAAALSVVVEPDVFGGSYELLAACRAACGLPAIAKDFIVHPRQLADARAAGADAVLLIAALYDREELLAWAGLARGLGLVPLVETHDPEDLELLTGERWELVGVNNRDLRTFEVDFDHALRLAPRLPAEAIKVAESGISAAAEIATLAAGGFDAFLIGSSLLAAEDPRDKLAELRGVRR